MKPVSPMIVVYELDRHVLICIRTMIPMSNKCDRKRPFRNFFRLFYCHRITTVCEQKQSVEKKPFTLINLRLKKKQRVVCRSRKWMSYEKFGAEAWICSIRLMLPDLFSWHILTPYVTVDGWCVSEHIKCCSGRHDTAVQECIQMKVNLTRLVTTIIRLK